MANEVRLSIRTLNLSASQLKQITSRQGAEWSNDLINDYLTIVQNFIDIATRIDAVIEQVDTNTENIEANRLEIIVNADNIEANRLEIIVVKEDLQAHVDSDSEHGVTGINVGTEDFCQDLIGGVVLLAGFIADAVASTAEVIIPDVGVAPGGYTSAYAQQQTDLINDVKSKHNQLVIELNAVVTQLNALLLSIITAKQMAAS